MNHDQNLQAFIKDFHRVEQLGFMPSHRKSNTGIGKTYEDLLGVAENNLKEPDLHGFEVKSQRAYSGSYVTLFTKSPTMPRGANAILKDKYGSQDEKYPKINVLHTSIFANSFNNHKSGFRFSLEINYHEDKLYLLVADQNCNVIDRTTYWTFSVLQKCLTDKLSRLAYVSAETRRNGNNQEEFHFNKAKIFSGLKSFQTFLDLLEEKKIMFDIRIGAYKTGTKKGKPHDHGSGFRIQKDNMNELYDFIEEIG